ncbi:hypothetical protein [Fibrella arboris]|uniref:hypothetical protein n=1 Tax=Fibrella arboris TaxID=3242486 RepID=UPI003521C290
MLTMNTMSMAQGRRATVFLLLSALLTLTGCTAYRPVAYNIRQTHSGAALVTPGWNGRITFWGKAWPFFIGPALAGGASAIYYQRDPNSFINSQTGQRQSMGGSIFIGSALGAFAPGYIPFSFLRKKRVKPRDYTAAQAHQWASQYPGRWEVYETMGTDLLIGPRGGRNRYIAEQKAILDRAEKARLDAEERARQAEIARELAAYDAFRTNESWSAYLDTFPTGTHIAEVRREGERLAFQAIRKGERRASATYLRYFPNGEHSAIVRQVDNDYRLLDGLWDTYYPTDTYDGYKQLIERCEQQRETFLKIRAEIADEKRELRPIYGALIEATETIKRRSEGYFQQKVSLRATRQERMATWVVGDNLCWKPASYSSDADGKRIPGTESETAIRVTIEEINADRTRFKIRVKELYNVKKGRNSDSFRMADANRIWELEELDWIDPLSEDMDFRKCL